MTIDAYLSELERALPRTGRDRALREVREHLRDAASRHRTGGASEFDAEAAATRDFGPVDEVARRLCVELAGRRRRVASVLVVGVTAAAAVFLAAGPLYSDRVHFGDSYYSEDRPTPVLIASRTIEAGTPWTTVAAEKMYVPTTLPAREVVDGAIANPSSLSGRAAAVELLPGEQLTEAHFLP